MKKKPIILVLVIVSAIALITVGAILISGNKKANKSDVGFSEVLVKLSAVERSFYAQKDISDMEELSRRIESELEKFEKEGSLASYEKGRENYYIIFNNGSTVSYTMNYSVDYDKKPTSEMAVQPTLSENASNILVIDNEYITVDSYQTGKNSAYSLTHSCYDFDTEYVSAADFNNASSLYNILYSLPDFDVVFFDGSSDYVESANEVIIKLSRDMSFSEYEKLADIHPEFDIRSNECIDGFIIGISRYDVATGTESDWQREMTDAYGRVAVSVTISVKPEFFRKFYANREFKTTLMYLGFGHSSAMNTLPEIFVDKGVDTVIGYEEEVAEDCKNAIVTEAIEKLGSVNDDTGEQITVSEAFELAVTEGRAESVGSLTISGDKDIHLEKIVNIPTVPAITVNGEKDDNPKQDNEEADKASVKGLVITGDIWSSEYDKYATEFETIKETKTFLTLEQMEAEQLQLDDLRERLRQEKSNNIDGALYYASRLFFIVSNDNGFMNSYYAYDENYRYKDIGLAFMSDLIGAYARNGRIGYYSLIYCPDIFDNASKNIGDFMNYLSKRSNEAREYTETEIEAFEMIRMYISTFLLHRENIARVGEALNGYANNFSKSDMNHIILQQDRDYYAKQVQTYLDKVIELEEYFK